LWDVHDWVLYENIEGHVASQWPLMTSEDQRMVQKGFFDPYPKKRSQDPMVLFCRLQRKIVFQRSLQALQQQEISVQQQLLHEFERLFIARRGDKPEKALESVLIEIWFNHLYDQYVIAIGQEQYFTPEERNKYFSGHDGSRFSLECYLLNCIQNIPKAESEVYSSYYRRRTETTGDRFLYAVGRISLEGHSSRYSKKKMHLLP
jgi:hypothetical protein